MRSFKSRLKRLSSAQYIVLFYLVAVTVSFLLLSLPIAHKPGVEFAVIDILFVAVSAVSVTGLTTVSTVDTFSVPGIFILTFVFQIGGIGVMTLSTFIWLLMGKKIGLKERQLIMIDQNQSSLSGLVNLMRHILLIILIIELVGAVVLGVYFLQYYPSWQEAFLHGFFASISATTNAGFDITGSSLAPFATDYFVQTVNILLITLGAIGFPVLIEVKQFIKNLNKKKLFRFSLFTKLTTVMYVGLLAAGTILILLLEHQHYLAGKSWHESFFYAFFQSATTRSAGLATMNVNEFTAATLLFLSILMFIGASPSSVGGGIRTTTFALNILFVFHFARGRKHIRVFNREIHEDDLAKSVVVSFMAIFICATATLLLMVIEPFSLTEIVFEVCSAFGTNGLSTGITPQLSTFGKLIIIVLMFIGRVGILPFIFMLGRPTSQPKYHYPKERIIIG
ncbi:TrkH family potassium uptake protein [Priestia abyssalis]|uniref:TrkH family potassium uptake protein n=1 Tax=Priestia abyssalis TaxID=1221450 RepID=UPI001472F3DD|nr:TrkH family potassium uptake protein [Priestia abyssalis]